MSDGRRFLDQLFYERREIRHLEELLEEKKLSTLPGTIMPKDIQVQTSKIMDPLGEAVVAAHELEEKIHARVRDLNRHKEAALGIIYQIEDSNYRTVLLLRYLKITTDGRRPEWYDIADEMGYELRHVHRLHARALDAFNAHYAEIAPLRPIDPSA